MRSVLEADAKEFQDRHLQKSYRKKLLEDFKDTVFNSEQKNLEQIKANASQSRPDGWVKLELKEGSKSVAFSPIQALGLREEALKEKVQGFEKRGWIGGSKSPRVARGFWVPKLGVNTWRLVIDYRYLNSCLDGHELR